MGAGFVPGDDPVPVLRPRTDAAHAAFTTRVGGSSAGAFATLNLSFVVGDDRDTVRRNRAVAGAAVGGGDRWSVVRQVHGGAVHRAGAPGSPLADGDALWTDDPSDTVAVLSADCVLLLICGPGGIAVAHAGWRGLVDGVVEAAVSAVSGAEVFAGPAIGPCCFEVGPEVSSAFAQRYPDSVVGDRHVDLWVAATAAATAAGARRAHAARICTSCRDDLFFSHRRDRGRTGRQALVARPAVPS